MPQAFNRLSMSFLAVAFTVARLSTANAAGTTLKVSLSGNMTGTMPTNLEMAMPETKGTTHGTNSRMGITIYQHTIKAGPVTFEVKNNSEKTIYEMLVLPIKKTTTPLPYIKSENWSG